jgi:hypothetical protein
VKIALSDLNGAIAGLVPEKNQRIDAKNGQRERKNL